MSKVLRRSGNAVVEYLGLIGFQPRQVFLAGVGGHHEEISVMRETWGRDFELYGWEPNPSTYEGLRETFPGFLRNKALWSGNGSLRLYARNNWKDGTTAFPPKTDDPSWKDVVVPCETLDFNGVPMNKERDGLLWLDCEGGELEVLKGASDMVSLNVGAINVELTCKPRQQGWPLPSTVHKWLQQHRFYQAWVHTIRPSIGQFDAIYLHESLYRIDFTCCIDAAARLMHDEILAPAQVLSQP